MPKHALIVDDSKTACRILAQLLQHYGIESTSMHSAEEALDYLRHNHPDMIFLDHGMPGMDGLEAMKVIKGNPETGRIPVMMYTGKEGDVYVGQARALGAVDVLPKTHLRERLEDALTKLEAGEAPRPRPQRSGDERDVRAMLRDVQSELSRQMYLILTEEQISRKGQLRGLMSGIDTALEKRVDSLARRLEADQEMLLDTAAQHYRRGLRWMAALALLVLVLGSALGWQLLRQDRDLSRLAGGMNEVRAGLARLPAPPAPADGGGPPARTSPAAGTRAPDATPRLLGLAPDGAGYQVLSTAGYVYRVDDAGLIGFELPERLFLAPNCNGEPLVQSPGGLVFRDETGSLWYTPRRGGALVERPSSAMGSGGECSPREGGRVTLRPLEPNQPEITGVGLDQQPVNPWRLR